MTIVRRAGSGMKRTFMYIDLVLEEYVYHIFLCSLFLYFTVSFCLNFSGLMMETGSLMISESLELHSANFLQSLTSSLLPSHDLLLSA